MLCCSEREKKLLIQAGIEENRLFIMGAPLQIIPDVISSDHFPKKYEILILAGQGTRELQYFYTQMLIQSKLIQSCTKGLLRTHPVFTQDESNLWMNSVPRFNRIPGSTLMMDIAQADLIVTFSLDAMIPCLWRGKKIILCYNPYHESLDFVKEIPFTKLATQKDELDKAILEFSNISEQMHTQSISHHLIDRFFGTCDIFRIKSNIENFLLHLNNYKIAV
ncbi:MAG: hypothetical protein A3H98_02595 [Bacteroidetes bacterium RIFCSPLOWO2_02_FULL_36_8]|nr:MAG: hypothetical protein A3H98_02595 [Bacteroidetes bacterium RIFCSPLOWO2_02_FULL_36_8]